MDDKNRLKAIEEELAYLRKSIEELKDMRVVEIHYHYSNISQNISKDEFDNPLYE